MGNSATKGKDGDTEAAQLVSVRPASPFPGGNNSTTPISNHKPKLVEVAPEEYQPSEEHNHTIWGDNAGIITVPDMRRARPDSFSGTLSGPNKKPVSETLAYIKEAYALAAQDPGLAELLHSGAKITGRVVRQAVEQAKIAQTLQPADSRVMSVTGSRKMVDRPISYVCYLCGRPYGSQSLAIHLNTCQKRWLEAEARRPDAENVRPLPPPPPGFDAGNLPTDYHEMEEFNNRMSKYWQEVSMQACPICGRTFAPHAYQKHHKVCTYETPGGPLGMPKGREPPPRPPAPAPPPPPVKKKRSPRTTVGRVLHKVLSKKTESQEAEAAPAMVLEYVCYLCAEKHPASSYFQHVLQCSQETLELEGSMGPSQGAEHVPVPSELDRPLPTEPTEVLQFNERMLELYAQTQTAAVCPACGESMRPSQLALHQQQCQVWTDQAQPFSPPSDPGSPVHTPIASGPSVTDATGGESDEDRLMLHPVEADAAAAAVPAVAVDSRPGTARQLNHNTLVVEDL